MPGQERGQDGFSHSRIGAGNEKDRPRHGDNTEALDSSVLEAGIPALDTHHALGAAPLENNI